VDPTDRHVIPDPQEDKLIQDVLEDDQVVKIGHNIGYDKRLSKAYFKGRSSNLGRRFLWAGETHDTQVLAHVATCGDELTYALKPLAKRYSGYSDEDEKELERAVVVARKEAKKKGWLIAGGKKEVARGDHVVFAGNKPAKADYWLAPPKLTKRYAVGDVERGMLIFLLWFPDIIHEPDAWKTYCREMQLFEVLRRMEERGTRVFPDRTSMLVTHYENYKREMRKRADEHDGYNPFKPDQPLNFKSSKQMQAKFYGQKKYEITYNEKTGRPTIDKNVLARWGATDPDTGHYRDPLAKAILEWGAANQTIVAFLNIYRQFWYPTDRKRRVYVLHPNYNQSGAVTGRMSCSDPNLQQVAAADTGLRRAEIEQRPRECFGPRPGCIWYMPDFSQVEVWLFAFLSGERQMQKLLLSGHDFHQGVADKSFIKRKDYQERRKYYRKLAKLIMFGKLYGGGIGTEQKPGRMTKLLEMPFKETKEFIDSFEAQFRSVKRFMRSEQDKAAANGGATNAYGRRYVVERDWAYKIVNYLIQGTAADSLKTAIVRLDWMIETRWAALDRRIGLLNNIHDELIIEVPYTLHSKRLQREIIYVMQMDSDMLGLPVPLPVEMKVAPRQWAFTDKVPMTDKEGFDKGENPEYEPWVRGGVPRDDSQHFADLQSHMRACPYHTEESFQTQFQQTRTYLSPIISAHANEAHRRTRPIKRRTKSRSARDEVKYGDMSFSDDDIPF